MRGGGQSTLTLRQDFTNISSQQQHNLEMPEINVHCNGSHREDRLAIESLLPLSFVPLPCRQNQVMGDWEGFD